MGRWLLALAGAAVGFGVAGLPPDAAVRPGPGPRPDFDVRRDAAGALRRPSAAQTLAWAELRSERPGARLRWDGRSAAPRWLSAGSGRALSPAFAGTPEQAARALLRTRSALVGLTPLELAGLDVTAVVPAPGGGSRVHFRQRAHGLEVFGGRMLVTLGADGTARTLGGSLFGGLDAAADPSIDAASAVRIAAADVYPDRPFAGSAPRLVDPVEQRYEFADEPAFAGPPRARLVLFPETAGARLAWEVRLAEPGRFTDYVSLIDAATGGLLYRRNVTVYAVARVLDGQFPRPHGEEFAPGDYRAVTLPLTTPQSPQGWISGAGTTLSGNNATSHLDGPTRPGPAEPDAIYDYPFNTQEASVTNAWYWVNDLHDRLYDYGFDEAGGNFQQDNFGQGGLGGDPMGVVQWAEGFRNNAFYSHAVDGEPASINMLWMSCLACGDHDGYPENGGDRPGAFDRSVVAHEYVHGVSHRMVGGGADGSCLRDVQSGALGEGWSDLIAATLYDDPHDGDYFLEGRGWVRGLRHDLGYGDLCQDSGCAVHVDGMIWAGTLWALRESMIALDPANGRTEFEHVVVQGMAETPCFPSMLDARDGILQADTLLFGSAHHPVIWNVFADRGMGNLASTTGEDDTSPVPDSTVPTGLECTAPGVPTGLSATAQGDNAIRLDYSAPGAAAVEIWREDLDNTIDTPLRISFTSDTTTFLDSTVAGSKSYRYHLVALGPGGTVCRSAASSTADATATGPCDAYPFFLPALTIADGAVDCTLTLSWTAAQDGCPGSGDPIVYNVYRHHGPGFDPSERLMIGRTTATTFQDIPPQDGRTYYYLVLAQHGTTADPADHDDRGSAQVLRWVPRLARLNRTTVRFWDFETGAQGWVADNTSDPLGAWVLRSDPTPTIYENALFAPDEPAGGAGQSWVTGDSVGPQSIYAFDSDGFNTLLSPNWPGTSGATILSFDYWASTPGGALFDGLQITITSASGFANVTPVELMGTQTFRAPGRYGWQRAELDLAEHVGPSPQLRVQFNTLPAWLSEFGIDNVRVESGPSCSRSALRIQSVSVDDTPPGWGDGDGLLEPGETAHVQMTLVNEGGATASAPSGVLRGGPQGLVIHGPSAGFPDIPPAATGTTTGNGFTISAPHELACGDTLVLDLEVVDAAGTVSRDSWFPETGDTATDVVLADDFETDQGWVVQGALAGEGIWQRGDPVGTLDGASQANPENDSPNDAGNQCYVTENGVPAGDPNATDVDVELPILFSPPVDLGGYKRARADFDLWFYTGATSSEDYVTYGAALDDSDGNPSLGFGPREFFSTGGWAPRQLDLTPRVPMLPDVRISIYGQDQDETIAPGFSDGVVEIGLDNVRIEADRPVCDLSSVLPPNGIGDTLRVDRTSMIELSWTASPVDAGHDPPAYYDVFVSAAPDTGFSVASSPMGTTASRAPGGADEYYLVTAVNAAGTSGDEPAP